MTICYVNEEVQTVLKKHSSSPIIPFENININDLYDMLYYLIDNNNIEYILNKGNMNRNWMETYWNPMTIIKEFEHIYDNLLK